MSIHIILGKPGSGKSLYGVHMVIRQLRETGRNIVTNLPLHPGRLNEYLQQRFPKENLRMVQRLRVMTDEEMREFWKFRGPPLVTEYDAPEQVPENARFGDDKGRGVAYFLDEAHIAFNARDWAVLGRGAIHYMSQHRKLGDIVFPITQAVGNLDKQFRSVAEDFTVMKNEAVAKLGPFRGAARFKRTSFYSEPSNNAQPFEVATFRLDKDGIASCYDTARGIGVHGSKADIGRRAAGISIYWVFPIVLAIALAVVAVPYFLGRAATSFVAGGPAKTSKGDKTAVQAAAPVASSPASSVGRPAAASSASLGVPRDGSAVWVVGSVVQGDRYLVILSDGRRFSEEELELSRATRAFVETKSGERFYWRPSKWPIIPAEAQAVKENPRSGQILTPNVNNVSNTTTDTK